MIDPHHTCGWSRDRRTEVAVGDSSFGGTGVSLRVLLHAFFNTDFVWFSIVYGQFDDNVLLVALDRPAASILEQVSHSATSPMRDACGDKHDFEEHLLSEQVQSKLGITLDWNSYEIEPESAIRYLVFLHDDCFSHVKPIDIGLLKQLVHCVLQQHSFYLGAEVDWSDVLDPITERLRKSSRLDITSKPERRCLAIPQMGGERSLIRRLFGLPPRCSVIIQDGRGCLVESGSK